MTVSVDLERIRELLDRREFRRLFIEELGWDNPSGGMPGLVTLSEDGVVAEQVATKRGVGVWRCDAIPPSSVRRRLDAAVSKQTRERLLVFAEHEEQVWMWPEQRVSGAGFRLIDHHHYRGTRNEGLLQRLAAASFSMEEEDRLTVMDVLARVRRSFNSDEVTRRFYKEFKEHHDSLAGSIDGMASASDAGWYASVLMNRVMFIYFLQRKGFLAGDLDYLRNRLTLVRNLSGSADPYAFYATFLRPLFHEALGSHLHDYADPGFRSIVGDVPYVDGGVFSPHPLETANAIRVPDRALEAIFGFLDRYRWHLDERPTGEPNEINPDVLGYIFEQYVNQKEQGAYYTKEDVTGYMTGVTVIPAFLDLVVPHVGEPWHLLGEDPRRYVFESVGYGEELALPEAIEAGIGDDERRALWSQKAPPSHGLPGETWWEVIDRRDHYRQLLGRLQAGEIGDTESVITANLDLRILADDFIRSLDDLGAVTAAYGELEKLTVLDPTCGSGAFLFAALEVLADLYEALIDRAEELATGTDRTPPFVAEARRHPNLRYFVLKSTLLNNLFGVDLMAEAGEIARLRMFLKLVAQLSPGDRIEPLPDLDFNIRTGNLLVGVATTDDAQRRLGLDLLTLAQLDAVEATAREAGALYREFAEAQQEGRDPGIVNELKAGVGERLAALGGTLDRLLYEGSGERSAFSMWERRCRPFHWFVEFPSVFARGGFDVVVGNPPYVRANLITEYRWVGYKAGGCPDIYAPCVERALSLVGTRGRFAMVVPHSLCFSEDYQPLRQVIADQRSTVWLSSFALMPDSLFTGVRIRNTVVVVQRDRRGPVVHSGWRNRWTAEQRPFLFQKLRYVALPAGLVERVWPFLGSVELAQWLDERGRSGNTLARVLRPAGSSAKALRYKKIAGYYVSMWPEDRLGDPPSVDHRGRPIPQTKVGTLWFSDVVARDTAFALGVGKWFFAWWAAVGDDFDVTKGVVESFPVNPGSLPGAVRRVVAEHLDALVARLGENVTYKGYRYGGRAGARIANYFVPAARDLTDQIDVAFARYCANDGVWRAVNLVHAILARSEVGE